MSTLGDDLHRILSEACVRSGLDPAGAEPIRIGENAIFRLPEAVARISRPGQMPSAVKEVRVARWLAQHNVEAVRVWDGVGDQPAEIDGRAVTWWEELPPHRHGTLSEVADTLRVLHALPIPTHFELAQLDPFARLTERIDSASTLPEGDQEWLRAQLDRLRSGYAAMPPGLPSCVIHGDAWVGNVVTTDDNRTILLDLERCSIGPPEWDLISTAIKHTSFAWVSEVDYRDFCRRYGHDVTTWGGFNLVRDIRELRMSCYLAQHSAEDPTAQHEAEFRVACLAGRRGPRPWAWEASA